MNRHRPLRRALATLALALVTGVFAPLATAQQVQYPTFVDPEFREVWERYDRPVFFGEASRSYTWGGQVSGRLEEPYEQGPEGEHVVQYFDKSRMEINNPDADKGNPFFVTQGLLARDMIRGEIQEGDTRFRQVEPAQIPFGDLDDVDTASPTYASFGGVLDAPPVPAGQPLTARIDRAGNVGDGAPSRGVTSAGVVPGTTNHSIAAPFFEFIQQSGLVYEDGGNRTEALFTPTFYVTGYPITEAYWARVKAAGAFRDVLIQCFERRCLTYTPQNNPEFRVELANTGLQYFNWRYPQSRDNAAPRIGGLEVRDVTATSATLAWKTDEAATTEVRFGTTDEYDRYQGDLSLVTEHVITLNDLRPNQEYRFQVSSADAAGNAATGAAGAFRTRPQSAPPAVGAVTATVTDTTATLAFTTTPATTVRVIYYASATPENKTNVMVSGPPAARHAVTLTGLAPGTQYTYQIVASGETGQTITPPQTFTTTGLTTTATITSATTAGQ